MTSKSSGRISSMKARNSSSVARRGSGAVERVAAEMVSDRLRSGRRYGSWSWKRAFFLAEVEEGSWDWGEDLGLGLDGVFGTESSISSRYTMSSSRITGPWGALPGLGLEEEALWGDVLACGREKGGWAY